MRYNAKRKKEMPPISPTNYWNAGNHENVGSFITVDFNLVFIHPYLPTGVGAREQ